MNHYPRHIGDWLRDTAHLSEIEECIYSRCVDQYYSREKPLPLDLGQCARLVRAASAAARKALATILPEFFTQEADGWHQKRCDEEIAHYHGRSESARHSVEARWNKRNTNVLPTNNERNTNQNQEPVTKVKTKAPALTRCPPDFAISDRVKTWAVEKGHTNLPAHFEKFTSYVKTKQPKYADWDEALMTCIRENWAKVGATTHTATAAWWTSEPATIAKGKELGIAPRGGESMADYRGRISESVSGRRTA